jgi:hypothetical protein
MIRGSVRIAAGLLAGVVTVTACGSGSSGGPATGHNDSSASPATELREAVHALGQGHALTVSLGLGASTAEILRLGASKNGHDGPTPQQAKAIATDRIVFEMVAPAGKTLADAAASPASNRGGAFAIRLQSPTASYFSFLVVDRSLYAQIDLKYFFGLGGALNQYRALVHRSASLPPFVQAALAGRWVSLPAATLQALEGFLKGASGGQLNTPAPSRIRAIENTALTTLLRNLTVARTATGSTDHLTITANVRRVLQREYDALFPQLGTLSQSFQAIPRPQFGKVPDRNVVLDADVTNGALSTLTLNTGQFSKSIPFSLPVTASFTRGGAPITAPSGATPIDLSQIEQLGGL